MTRYRALVGMNIPVNDAENQRVLVLTAKGEEVTDRKLTRVEAGHIAKYIPEDSIPWLLKSGYIEEVTDGKDL